MPDQPDPTDRGVNLARWEEALAFARACEREDIEYARHVSQTSIGTGFGLELRIAGMLVLAVDQLERLTGDDRDLVWARLLPIH